MKKQSNTLFTKFSNVNIASLTKEVKETIAFGLLEPAQHKIFTTADLWNIQRQGKSRVQRRYL